MWRKELKIFDGFTHNRPWLRSEVRRLQMALGAYGFAIEPDGLFGAETLKAVRSFQERQGLKVSGHVTSETWKALAIWLHYALEPFQRGIDSQLTGFRGDLDWIRDQKSHRGRPYWPGGSAGVTLDPGVDLGSPEGAAFVRNYANFFNHDQYCSLKRVIGLRGQQAKDALDADPLLQNIQITHQMAIEIMPYVAKPVWEKISFLFPSLKNHEMSPAVQTVVLSLAYKQGEDGLEVLREPMEKRDWPELARMVYTYNLGEGMEAELIRADLD